MNLNEFEFVELEIKEIYCQIAIDYMYTCRLHVQRENKYNST